MASPRKTSVAAFHEIFSVPAPSASRITLVTAVDSSSSNSHACTAAGRFSSAYSPTIADVSVMAEGASFPRKEDDELKRSIPNTATTITTSDQLLAIYGPSNPYICYIWASMSVVWTLIAMPILISAFLMKEFCVDSVSSGDGLNSTSGLNFTQRPGVVCMPQDNTMQKEFNLVGDRASLAGYATMSYFIGVTIGTLFLPNLSDRKGRRMVLLVSMTFFALFGMASAAAPDIYSFLALRGIQGFFYTGVGITNWILAYESIPIQLRPYNALLFGLLWVAGYCAVAPMAYFIQSWRWFVFAASAPGVLCVTLFYFTIPESFHYMVSHGDWPALERWMEAANRWARLVNAPTCRLRACEMNLVRCDSASAKAEADAASCCEAAGIADERSSNASSEGLLRRLTTSRPLLLYTLVMIYLWSCDTFVYYGLSLFSTQLAGNEYLNFALLGAIEAPSYLVSPFLLNLVGRRLFVSVNHFLAAIAFFGIIFAQSSPTLHVVVWLIGKFGISCAFTSLFVYASDLFPTTVRNGSLGVCEIFARIAGSMAPMAQHLVKISPIAPTLFFGVCAAIAGLLTLLLPETKDRELADSMGDIIT